LKKFWQAASTTNSAPSTVQTPSALRWTGASCTGGSECRRRHFSPVYETAAILELDSSPKIAYYRSMELAMIPEKYRRDIEGAALMLKNEGCESVYLFGSMVTGKAHQNSDIDIGIKGFPKGMFFKIYSKLYFTFDSKIDLVDFDKNPDFYALLDKLGEVVKIG
jgi:predicted nucleotidyltransferase